MAEAEILKFNNGTFEIADKKARSQLNNIANEDLVIGEDGKLHIKQADGTEKGTGVEIPTSTAEVPDNVVTWEEETETDEDIVTAQNIRLVDASNNFDATDVEGALSELFQSASNGKSKIATAITGKGVDTSSSDTFEQMATNIGQIQTGSTGITPTGSINITENGTYDVANYASAIVNIPTSTTGESSIETGTFTGANELEKTITTQKEFTNFLLMTDDFSTTIAFAQRSILFLSVIDSVLRYQITTNNTGNSAMGYIKSANGTIIATLGTKSITLKNYSNTTPTHFGSGTIYRWYAW